nr:MAG TPA: hypothetical protein [Caudoviricetes sp.]
MRISFSRSPSIQSTSFYLYYSPILAHSQEKKSKKIRSFY